MWRLIGKLPRECTVAISGGADSMALLHFLAKDKKRKLSAAMFNHGTQFHNDAYPIVKDFCDQYSVELFVSDPAPSPTNGVSLEEFWRDRRYEWLDTFPTVVTGHHLDDVVETWIWSALHGTPKLIPYQRNNISRPLLAVSRSEILDYCDRHSVPFINDPANANMRFARSKVRHDLMPIALDIHPGLRTTIRNKVLASYE